MSRVEVLGVGVDPLTATEIIERIESTVAWRGHLLVGNHNLHSTYLVREQPEMRAFYERADIVYVDGMPLVVADRGRTLHRTHRVTLLDWIDPLLDAATAGRWNVFLLGSAPGTIGRAVAALGERHPAARLFGRDGYFADDDEVVAEINRAAPDLLLVGMGMPRQEVWLARNIDRLDVPVAMTVGGLFDYFAGASYTPPRWMGRVGLEWLGRLAADPRRLAHRYLVEPMLLARHLVRERHA